MQEASVLGAPHNSESIILRIRVKYNLTKLYSPHARHSLGQKSVLFLQF